MRKRTFKRSYTQCIIVAEAITTARKWGNSLGFRIPIKIIKEENIKPNDRVIVRVKKIVPLREIFGTLKTNKSTQELKDEMRAGWDG